MKTIKDINFLPEYVTEKHVNTKRNFIVGLWVVFYLSIAAFLFLAPKAAYSYFERDEKQLNGQLTSLSDIQKKVDNLNQINQNKQKKISALGSIDKKQQKMVDLIDKISNAMPDRIKIKNYSIHGKDMNIAFVVNSPVDVVEVMNDLEGLKIFDKISVNTSPVVDMNYTMGFTLKLK